MPNRVLQFNMNIYPTIKQYKCIRPGNAHNENIPIYLTPLNPTFIELIWGLQGYTLLFSLIFAQGGSNGVPTIYVLSRNMKNGENFNIRE